MKTIYRVLEHMGAPDLLYKCAASVTAADLPVTGVGWSIRNNSCDLRDLGLGRIKMAKVPVLVVSK